MKKICMLVMLMSTLVHGQTRIDNIGNREAGYTTKAKMNQAFSNLYESQQEIVDIKETIKPKKYPIFDIDLMYYNPSLGVMVPGTEVELKASIFDFKGMTHKFNLSGLTDHQDKWNGDYVLTTNIIERLEETAPYYDQNYPGYKAAWSNTLDNGTYVTLNGLFFNLVEGEPYPPYDENTLIIDRRFLSLYGDERITDGPVFESIGQVIPSEDILYDDYTYGIIDEISGNPIITQSEVDYWGDTLGASISSYSTFANADMGMLMVFRDFNNENKARTEQAFISSGGGDLIGSDVLGMAGLVSRVKISPSHTNSQGDDYGWMYENNPNITWIYRLRTANSMGVLNDHGEGIWTECSPSYWSHEQYPVTSWADPSNPFTRPVNLPWDPIKANVDAAGNGTGITGGIIVSRVSMGEYLITFPYALDDNSYSVVVTPIDAYGSDGMYVGNKGAGNFKVYTATGFDTAFSVLVIK